MSTDKMAVDNAASTSTSDSSSVVVTQSTQSESQLDIRLHPLAILNITEHFTRVSFQKTAAKVLGVVIGTQNGRDVEIFNSFEVPAAALDTLGNENGFFQVRRSQFKQVFPTFDVLGWYAIGVQPTQSDLDNHLKFLPFNDSPLFVQFTPASLSPTASNDKDLPISIYESVSDLVANKQRVLFNPVGYRVETGEAERIAVDHASKPVEDGKGDSALIVNMTSERNATKMLLDRIEVIADYLERVDSGSIPPDHSALREISALVSSLPSTESESFKAESQRELADALLAGQLLPVKMAGLQRSHELIDKFAISSTGGDGRSSGGGKGGRRGGPHGGY